MSFQITSDDNPMRFGITKVATFFDKQQKIEQ